jgi:ketosteroid isomerase-like protein
MSRENVAVVRQALDALNGRDVDAFVARLHPDVVTDWSRAVGPERGVFRGHDEVVRFLHSWWGAFEESVFIVDEVIDAGDDVVVAFHGRQTGRGSGAIVEGRGSVLVWSLTDGTVVSATLYQTRDEALAAVGMRQPAGENEHLRAAGKHERRADFWEREGRTDKAQSERDKAREQRRAAEAEERQGLQGGDTEAQ